jgi:hypothetical protein
MIEKRWVPIMAYRTPDGTPTCAVDFDAGEVCVMLRSTRWGLADVCALDVDKGRKTNGLQRDAGGTGYLIPCDGCIVWPDVEK